MTELILLCVAIRHAWASLWAFLAPEPFNLEKHIMALSDKAQALADELAALPALISADRDKAVADAVAADSASHAADLAGIKEAADKIAAVVNPAPVVVADPVVAVAVPPDAPLDPHA